VPYYALLFSVITVNAAVFGFGGIAAGAASIAKLLFFVFLVFLSLRCWVSSGGNARGVATLSGLTFDEMGPRNRAPSA
jgi:uncharacterized membrane protein YtjA (UPF0391 family)